MFVCLFVVCLNPSCAVQTAAAGAHSVLRLHRLHGNAGHAQHPLKHPSVRGHDPLISPSPLWGEESEVEGDLLKGRFGYSDKSNLSVQGKVRGQVGGGKSPVRDVKLQKKTARRDDKNQRRHRKTADFWTPPGGWPRHSR